VRLGDAAPIHEVCEPRAFSKGTREEALERAARARSLLLAPLDLPPGVRRVLLSPDGGLAQVPWPMVALGDPEQPPLEVTLVPSATTWRILAEGRKRTGRGLLALGDPLYERPHRAGTLEIYARGRSLPRLEHSGDEVRALVRGEEDEALVREAATEAALRERLADGRRRSAIVLACHGLLDGVYPERTALALTAADDDDGFLTALEVFGLHVPADLVVLSACESGRGRLLPGEGLEGLPRAFLAAGAPRVIVSLWKVDDGATRALVEAFFRSWRQGATTSGALADAQRFVAAQPDWSHPRYWAAWTLWGLPD
jgi:CHAT domain-containing protein